MKISYDLNWRREYSLFYGLSTLYSLAEWEEDELGYPIIVRGEGLNGWFATYSQKGALQKVVSQLSKSIKKDTKYMEKSIRRLNKNGQDLVNFTKRLKSRSLSKSSNNELKRSYDKYFNYLKEYCICLWQSFYMVEAASIVFEERLREKVSPIKLNEAIQMYSQPSKKSIMLFIKDYFEKVHDKKKRILYIKRNFPWMGNTDVFSEPLQDSEIIDYVNSFKTQEEAAVRQGPLSNDKIIKIYQELLYIKDKRDEYRREAFYHGLVLMKEIADRMKISLKELGLLAPGELFSRNYKTLIKERKHGYIIEYRSNKTIISQGGGKKLEILQNETTKDVSEFKGTIGCPGIAKGEVQLIKGHSDIKKFKKGNILVSITTHPDYIPAMHKASGFITDEGGITCHAAIVSRELGKPCIVGTKIATSVLKDGMVVEVRANHGLVKILKK